MIKAFLIYVFQLMGYQLNRVHRGPKVDLSKLPDADCYRPFFLPWLWDGPFKELYRQVEDATLVSPDRAYTLWTLTRQARTLEGLFLECGVYKGGTARLLADTLALLGLPHQLHLFDTFEGMPDTGAADFHKGGDFKDASFDQVRRFVANPERVVFHQGFIPDTFRDLPDERIAFAHVDVDIHDSIMACCEFIYPRLLPGGVMVFDDYGFCSCPGARLAVDRFFQDKPEQPLVLANAQAVVFKL